MIEWMASDMLLKALELKNFRGFRDERIEFDDRLTVIVGMNGAGKTTILDALAILLDQYSARLLGSASSARRITENDTSIGAPETRIRIHAEHSGQEVRWTLQKQGKRQRILNPSDSQLGSLNQLVRSIAEGASDEGNFLAGSTLPIFYDQRRGLADLPKRKTSKAKHSATDAFVESRTKGGLDFRGFVYWFEERESEELRRQRREPTYVDVQLEAVRKAILGATELQDLTYRSVPPRGLLVWKNKVELRVDQLSTGERVFMAMAGDLARRLAMLSDGSIEPNHGRAIVLIDEVELHLHPAWQRKILPWMLRAFPNCQFVVTTHSPQVVGDVEAQSIRVVQYRKDGNRLRHVAATKGRDSNFLLLSVFSAEERSTAAKKLMSLIEGALKSREYSRARQLLEKLRDGMEGAAPELAIAEARIDRQVRSDP